MEITTAVVVSNVTSVKAVASMVAMMTSRKDKTVAVVVAESIYQI
jgi:hypothetical protein